MCALVSVPLGAQSTHVDSTTAWFTQRDWRVLGAFAVGAAVAMPFDAHLARQVRRPSVQRARGLSRTASVVRSAGDPGAVLASLGVFAAGELARNELMADVGLHTAESVLLSGFTSGVIKRLIGRARPYTVRDTDAFVLRPFQRVGGYTSFPSGHTTVAFAAASALQAEWRRSAFAQRHRRWTAVVTPTLFGAATAVGLSRMYHDAHWASDVIAAAGIGTVAGQIMVRAQHGAQSDRVDRWLLPSTLAPSAHGMSIAWHTTF